MKKIALLLFCFLTTSSCNGNIISTEQQVISASPSSILSDDVINQLQNSQNQNEITIQNALNQSKIAFNTLVLKFNSIPIDSSAFDEMKTKLLTPMVILATSLNNIQDKNNSLFTEFNSIYSDSLSNMLRGINNNLLIYQATLETSQSLISNSPNSSLKGMITDEAIVTLAKIFKSSEALELFVTQLGQFTNVIPSDDTKKVLEGIKSQQNIIINGITNFISNGDINREQALEAYNILISSLINPVFLNPIGNIAKKVFGNENVALIRDEITPNQSNPNLTVMVIKENQSTFRKIRIQDGKVINQVVTDTRNLSASDILNESNVNIIKINK
ncbi:MAG: hypothetical protein KatS3mg068_1350 [Candidatus Sericytochromatia bacterium]|nr:MAG: hypothetical protein KatS3mg068_1350 [Candidatus Sericytochromatia bacterium]